jgi:hypothetical protein
MSCDQEVRDKEARLCSAASLGHTHVLRELLAAGVNPDAFTANSMPAMHMAAFYGHHEAVKILLGAGSSARLRGPKGLCPLRYAAIARDVMSCKILLDAGADVSGLADDKTTPLHSAARNGDGPCARLLVAHGACPTTPAEDPPVGYLTPFQLAVQRGRLDMIEYFSAVGDVDFNQVTRSGKRLDELAAAKPHVVARLRALAVQQAVQSAMTVGHDVSVERDSAPRMRAPSML